MTRNTYSNQRGITLRSGHVTSVRLEPEFWHALRRVAYQQNMSLQALLGFIEVQRRCSDQRSYEERRDHSKPVNALMSSPSASQMAAMLFAAVSMSAMMATRETPCCVALVMATPMSLQNFSRTGVLSLTTLSGGTAAFLLFGLSHVQKILSRCATCDISSVCLPRLGLALLLADGFGSRDLRVQIDWLAVPVVNPRIATLTVFARQVLPGQAHNARSKRQ